MGEVALRDGGEVGVEFGAVGVVEEGDGGGALVGEGEEAAVGGLVGEVGGGGLVELADQRFFPVGPAGFIGGAGVGVGVEEKGVQPFAAPHDFGEAGDDFGVVEIPGGGGVPEEQVVIDEEQ